MSLARLKDRLMGDARTVEAISTLRELYAGAEDEEAFHRALGEGDIERAVEHHPLSESELREE